MKNSIKISLVTIVTLFLVFLLGNFNTPEQSTITQVPQESTSEIVNDETDQLIKKALLSRVTPYIQNSLKESVEALKNNPDEFFELPAACFAPGTDQSVIDDFYKTRENIINSLAPGMASRFNLGGRWTSTATDGGGLGQGDITTLTWSYVPDGTVIQNGCGVPGESTDPSSFIAYFNGIFGGPTTPGDLSTAPWHINLFVPMFQSWSNASGLIFVYEPNDDGAPTATTANQGVINTRGDMRISGHALDGGGASVLACNYFPTNGDMIIDTSDDYYANNPMVGTTNVLTHEIGHGLGLFHVCPVNLSKLMEPTVTTAFLGPQEDDILATNRHYGDSEGFNDTSAAASFLGNTANPVSYDKMQRSIDDNADVDYFSFTVSEASVLTGTLTPTGTTYLDGVQLNTGVCTAGSAFNALIVSDIMVEVLGTDGSSVIATANANGPGLAENIVGVGLPLAGTYFVRVRQQGASIDNVQMYDLNVSLTGGVVADNDVAITAIVEPAAVEIGLTNAEQLVITLSNVGALAQSNIPYEVTINNVVVANEVYSPSLAGGTSVNINVPTLLDLSDLGTYNICVATQLVGDEDTANDEICKTVEHTICIPTTANGCDVDGIKQFVLGTINADDGAQGCNTDPGAPQGYADRTALVTDLDRSVGNNIYTLQASTFWNDERIKVWIDFNENNDFTDPGEEVLNQVFTITDGTLENFSITIPSGTSLGTKLLRARGFDASADPSTTGPCDDITWGETQDYTVNIIDTAVCLGPTITWNGTGWIGGIAPGVTDIAVINGAYDTATDGNIDACQLIVNAIQTLTVDANTYVRMQSDITVNGTLIVSHQGSLVQVDDAALVTNSGSIEVQVTTPNLDARDFMVIGSPMTAEVREDLAGFRMLEHNTSNFNPNPAIQLLFPDGTNFTDDDLSGQPEFDWTFNSGVLNSGEGYYYIPGPNLQTGGVYNLAFNDGTLNNGVVNYATTFGDNQNDSPNILSNPYPSGIDTALFINGNAAVNEVYFWNHDTNPGAAFPGANDAYYNMSDISVFNTLGGAQTGPSVISTGQGFGIKAISNDGIVFNNSMRVQTGNTTLRSPEVSTNKLWLELTNDVYDLKSNMLVGFTPEATAGYDAAYDSKRITANVSLYSMIAGEEQGYAIQGREAFNSSMTIPLGFQTLVDEATTYTIKLADLEGLAWESHAKYLVDRVTNTVTNLGESGYTFTAVKGNYTDRFVLQFDNEEVLNTFDNLVNSISLYPNPANNRVSIWSPNASIENVTLIDMQGRIVSVYANVAKNMFSFEMNTFTTATYFVKIQTTEGLVTKRIIKK